LLKIIYWLKKFTHLKFCQCHITENVYILHDCSGQLDILLTNEDHKRLVEKH